MENFDGLLLSETTEIEFKEALGADGVRHNLSLAPVVHIDSAVRIVV